MTDRALLATHRHKKRGTLYRIVGISTLQFSGMPTIEGMKIVHYVGEDGQSWSRPQQEFDDGRFEQLDSAIEDLLPEQRTSVAEVDALRRVVSQAAENLGCAPDDLVAHSGRIRSILTRVTSLLEKSIERGEKTIQITEEMMR